MKGSFYKRNCKCPKEKKKCNCGASWSFMIDVGRDPGTGKRKQRSKGGFKTKKEAQASCAELITEIEQGTYSKPSKMTLAKFMEGYIETEVKPNVKPATLYNYEKVLENYIAPRIGNMKITDITPLHIQDFYSHLTKDRKLKAGSIKVVHSALRKTLACAFTWGIVKSNPASVVKSPKVDKQSDNVWDLNTCMKFLKVAKEESHYYHVYLLAIFTGLRRGEVLGLPLDNIDTENSKIKIDQQLIIDPNTSIPYLSSDLKSKSSYRTMEIPHEIMKELKEHVHERKKLLLSKGYTNKHNLVFCSKYGNWIHPNGINKDFRLLTRVRGFKHIPFHGLRHSHATILSELKENVHAISQRLGHSSVTITNEVYVHLTEKMEQSLNTNLNNLYESQRKDQR